MNYIDLLDIYRLAISLGMLQQDRRWDFWGSFLVMPRWFGLTAGRTGPSVREPPNADRQPALLPVGLSATTLPYPIFLFPLHSTVPEKVKLNHEIKVTITITG